jgi:glycosyltransferase involved in cell wall biosynthesis
MKIAHVHNYYRYRGGEDAMFERICHALRSRGQRVCAFVRRSEADPSYRDKFRAFTKGIYSWEARGEFETFLDRERPDLVHVHNLYPLISVSALDACRTRALPVVMRCPNYRLICPSGGLFRNGEICERCVGGHEYRCALSNCRGHLAESVAYAARGMLAARRNVFRRGVSILISPSEFVRQRLIRAGFAPDRIAVIPNMVPLPDHSFDPARGGYVAYAGRVDAEKGIDTLLDAARLLPSVPVRIAGDGPLRDRFAASSPRNVTFLGSLGARDLAEFYRGARVCVVPSRWFEAFGLVAAEAMSYGLPVVASRMGGLVEIVEDGKTGVLFRAGDPVQLAHAVYTLWHAPQRCRAYGVAGRAKVAREYCAKTYYERLIPIYERAQLLARTQSQADAVATTLEARRRIA